MKGKRLSTVALGLMHSFIFVSPAWGYTRNDVLFDLKDTFNSPGSSKITAAGIIFILLVCALVFWATKFDSSRNQKALRASRETYFDRLRNRRSNQKRNWFRLKTDAEFLWISVDQVGKGNYNKDKLIDISGGGLSYSTDKPINYGDEIRLLLALGDRTPMPLNGRVLRIRQNQSINTVSVQFIGIRDGQRDRIISWITNKERNAIQEELLEDDTPDKSEGSN